MKSVMVGPMARDQSVPVRFLLGAGWNQFEIDLKPCWHRLEIDLGWICYGFALDLEWILNGFEVDLKWI